MKQDFRSYALVKAIALLLTVACAVGAAFSWVYCGYHWDSLFDEEDYTSSALWSQAANSQYGQLMSVLEAYDVVRRGGTLGYLEQKYYDVRLSGFAPSATNFRYIIRDNDTGEILLSTSGTDSLEFVEAVWSHVRTTTPDSIYYNYRQYDEAANITIFYNDNGDVIGQVHGHASNLYAEGETYRYAIEYGVDQRLLVDDDFRAARNTFNRGDIRVLYLACGLTAVAVALMLFLMCCAGRRRGAEDFTRNWLDKIPYDLYLCVLLPALILTFSLGVETLLRRYWYIWDEGDLALMNGVSALCLAGAAILSEAILMSTASRIKTHTLLKNTLTWRILKWIGRCLRRLGHWWRVTFGNWNITQRVLVGFLLYLVGTVLTSLTVVLIPFYQGAVLFLLCRWTEEWRRIRQGTQAIVGGAPETVIDPSHMRRFSDLREHAEALNDLGSAINTAVDERLKSERMKAELITNVSHDLKTPLTSIINYVDLLKKEDIQEEKAREYIEVLDRKSQRLKKLTEDLVEASKASTGAIAVDAERLGVVQLVDQALGEYSEKFAAAQLSLLPSFPPEEHYVMADGRHFWRVLDNLLGNCVKYAMPGTRVYLDMTVWDGWVTLSVKNISAGQLNIPAEQLMERFVRGDESRTTEGSGLGLSIARSLTELQGGRFRLDVDGDLFKAVVSFPEA